MMSKINIKEIMMNENEIVARALYGSNSFTERCMKEAIHQALKRACEEAEITTCVECKERNGVKFDVDLVDPESIMSVLNDIEE